MAEGTEALLNIYTESAVCEWQKQLTVNFNPGLLISNRILFPDDNGLLIAEAYNSQIATQQINNTF
jgi:hypothetical protein